MGMGMGMRGDGHGHGDGHGPQRQIQPGLAAWLDLLGGRQGGREEEWLFIRNKHLSILQRPILCINICGAEKTSIFGRPWGPKNVRFRGPTRPFIMQPMGAVNIVGCGRVELQWMQCDKNPGTC